MRIRSDEIDKIKNVSDIILEYLIENSEYFIDIKTIINDLKKRYPDMDIYKSSVYKILMGFISSGKISRMKIGNKYLYGKVVVDDE